MLGFVIVILCLPILAITYHPLVDYPNHLARAHILHRYSEVAQYQLSYRRLVEPIPNVALDVTLLLLLRFVPLLTASKIFLVSLVLLFVAGCHQLGRAIHGRPTWLALPCSFFVYNSMFLYGFVNYVFGVALFCIGLAAWLRSKGRWTALRLLGVSALVLTGYLAHLSAYAFLGVTFVVVTAWSFFRDGESWHKAIVGLIPLLPPLLLFVLFMGGSGQTGEISWNTLSGKVVGLLALVLSYDYLLDAVLLGATGVLALMTLYCARRIEADWPLFAAGILFMVFFLASPVVLFTSSAADVRFVPPAILLLVLSLKLDVRGAVGKWLLAGFLLIASIRIASIAATWASLDTRIAAEVQRLNTLPEGASVYPISEPSTRTYPFFAPTGERQRSKAERSFGHIIHYATTNRHAYVPTLFAIQGQQPLVFRKKPTFSDLRQDAPERALQDMSGYDYVWIYGASEQPEQLLAEKAVLVRRTDGFTLWRLDSAPPPGAT